MVVAIALPGVILFLATGLMLAARLLRIGALDRQALAEKVAFPEPASALEWPELRVRHVVPEPGGLSPVLLQVGWPAYPSRVAILLVTLDPDEQRALSLLCQWSDTGASVVAERHGTGLELRRRQSLETVHASLIAEDYQAAA